MISAMFIFALMTWWSILIGVVFWPLTTSMLVNCGRLIRGCAMWATRSFQYKAYYPAKSRLSSRRHGQRRAGNSRSWIKGAGGLNDFWTGVVGDSVRGCIGVCLDRMGGSWRQKLRTGRKWVAGLPNLLLYASHDRRWPSAPSGWGTDGDAAVCRSRSRLRHSRRDAALAERLNSVLKLGSGWLVQLRMRFAAEVNEYAKQGAFPDSVTS